MPSLDEFLVALWDCRATAILRASDERLAAAAMDAAIRGGMRIVELTLTTPGALRIVSALAARQGLRTPKASEPEEAARGDLWVGAGTVLLPAQARAAVEAGARFLVSPVMDPEIIAVARELGVPVLPGVHTPTEMLAAHRAGAPLLKLFPAPAGGPVWLRSVLAPLPFLRVVPTNGVDQDNAAAWLQAGAFAVGLTTTLFDPAVVAAGDLAGIEQRARALLRAVESVERGPMPRVLDPLA